MRAAVFLSLLSAASAFVAPMTPVARSRGALKMSVQDMVGIDVETGGLFDPLGFAKDERSLYRYRCVELKHGRVAMLATLGTLVQSFVTLPDPVFAGGARPQTALVTLLQERPLAVLQIVLFLIGVELTAGQQDESKAPGELGRFGEAWKPDNEEDLRALQLKELKNGRLAMVAIVGQLVQEKLTGQGPIEQLLAGHISPFGVRVKGEDPHEFFLC